MNPQLPGLSPTDIIVLSEKAMTVADTFRPRCFKRCITHFGEEGYPYYSGEKTCMDRCMMKAAAALDISRQVKQTQINKQAAGEISYAWMAALDEVHSAKAASSQGGGK